MEHIRSLALNKIISFNKSNVSMHIELLDNYNIDNKYRKFGIDARINDERCKRYSVVFAFLDNITDELLGICNLIIFSKELYSDIEFWSHNDQEGLIKKVNLSEFKGNTNDYTMVLGFGRSSENLRSKYVGTKFYIELVKEILNKADILLLAECTGTEHLTVEKVSDTNIIYESENLFKKENLGVIREESITGQKIVEYLKLKPAKSIYHLRTLGQIYFNKELSLD